MDIDRDPELEAALAALQRFPQAEVAERVGMSVRRLRDIERGRSRPRRATRDLILQSAADVKAEREGDAPAEGSGSGSLVGPVILGALTFVGLMVLIVRCSPPPLE